MSRGRLMAASAALIALAAGGAGTVAAAQQAPMAHAAHPLPRVVPGKLIVGFRQGVSGEQRRAALSRAGAAVGESLGSARVQLVTVAPAATARVQDLLEGNRAVRYVEPDRRITIDATSAPPNDTLFAKQWGLSNTGQAVDFTAGTPGADIGALRAWPVTTGR